MKLNKLPDIDIDFCMRRRGELIEYVCGENNRDLPHLVGK